MSYNLQLYKQINLNLIYLEGFSNILSKMVFNPLKAKNIANPQIRQATIKIGI